MFSQGNAVFPEPKTVENGSVEAAGIVNVTSIDMSRNASRLTSRGVSPISTIQITMSLSCCPFGAAVDTQRSSSKTDRLRLPRDIT